MQNQCMEEWKNRAEFCRIITLQTILFCMRGNTPNLWVHQKNIPHTETLLLPPASYQMANPNT